MVSISEKAKAIQVLQTELDSLMANAEMLSKMQIDLHTEFVEKMQTLNRSQVATIEKIIAVEETMSKLLKEK